MSEQKHTPEPWVIYGQGIDGPLDEFGSKQIVVYQVERKEDARRIVACVNACAGIDTEFLEVSGIAGLAVYRTKQITKLERQRDQLLEALKTCLECEFAVTEWAAIEKARAAIAAVEGGNQP